MLSVLLKLRLDGERVRGDLRYDEEDSDLDLPDKRVDSHGRKGESSLLFIRPRVDPHFCPREARFPSACFGALRPWSLSAAARKVTFNATNPHLVC